MRVAVESGDWKETGRLMHAEWTFRRRNLPTISTKTIDAIINGAKRKGALAGEIFGAGGGGCVVLLIEPDARERGEKAVVDCRGGARAVRGGRHGGARGPPIIFAHPPPKTAARP